MLRKTLLLIAALTLGFSFAANAAVGDTVSSQHATVTKASQPAKAKKAVTHHKKADKKAKKANKSMM